MWDCFCKDISTHDNEKSVKLRLNGGGKTTPTTLNQIVIDDFYIGEAKPDAAIEGYKKNRFTSSVRITDTLKYLFFNSGLSNLNSTTTQFYWSTDTILDNGDLLLGNKIELPLGDTLSQWSEFVYTKPTLLNGKYYIFYKVDATNQVDEMREYDNIGYFELYQNSPEALPYYNDFETNTSNWRHNSSLGNDEWIWSTLQGTTINTAFSGSKAFVTNDTGIVSSNSRMHLFTPIFNLSELQSPIMEFDLMAHFYGVSGYGFWPYNMGNLMYSINGGKTWEVLDSTNLSFKRLYYRLELSTLSGLDYIPTNGSGSSKGELLLGKFLPMFRSQFDYQGRDYDDNHHYVVDLSFLRQNDQVQFMFVYANYNAPVEGMMLDNFEIREAEIDLIKPSKKKLMVSSSDSLIRQNIKIKNNNNYISSPTEINIYCSSDTILDGQDILIGSKSLEGIRPYESFLTNIAFPTPNNYNTFNYLLIEIDPLNLNLESNENNNISYFELNMDTAINYNYPILFDFNNDEVNGWTWYSDSSGYYPNGHRFRHKTVINDFAHSVQNGQWFLDPINSLGTTDNFSLFDTYYLETPPFDFSNISNLMLNFDFLCIGDEFFSGSGRQGGNFQYSKDGGSTWTILTNVQDSAAINWYDWESIHSLNNEPGWSMWDNWTTARYNLSFLSGEISVRFRFKFKSFNRITSYLHGFRLDNFKIKPFVETRLPIINICENETTSIFGVNTNVPGNHFDTLVSSDGFDSIVIQELIVHEHNNTNQIINLCIGDSILLAGDYQSSDGFYYDSLQSIYGCDSIIINELIINENYNIHSYDFETCYGTSVNLYGTYYDTAGVYYDSLQSISGCDSIISFSLTINPLPNVSLDSFSSDTICSNSGLLNLNGQPPGGLYIGSGVSGSFLNTATAGFGERNIIYTYADNNYCHNRDTINFVIDACLSIDDISDDFDFTIYPNPSKGKFTVEVPLNLNKKIQFKLLDASSRVIIASNLPVHKYKKEFDLENYSNGVYYLHVRIDNKLFIKEIVKN
jgi:hypothetical protein